MTRDKASRAADVAMLFSNGWEAYPLGSRLIPGLLRVHERFS
jgi:hypothetical protein